MKKWMVWADIVRRGQTWPRTEKVVVLASSQEEAIKKGTEKLRIPKNEDPEVRALQRSKGDQW